MGSTLIEKAAIIFQRSKPSPGSRQRISTFPFPEGAASALHALVKRAAYLATETRSCRALFIFPSLSVSPGTYQPGRCVANLDELFAADQIPFAPTKLARALHEAKMIADEPGYPVVMKVTSADILHKSDAGGIVLNIQTPEPLLVAYTQILESVGAAKPDAKVNGVHLQRQILSGQEVILGAMRDLQFGPLMMFGSGGVEVAFALAPLTQAEALEVIRKTWAGRKLAGFRDISPADEESVSSSSFRIS